MGSKQVLVVLHVKVFFTALLFTVGCFRQPLKNGSRCEGPVYVSCYDAVSGCIKCMAGSLGSWENLFIYDSTAAAGYCSSIGLDSRGKVSICYEDDHFEVLKYSTNSSGVWNAETVDPNICGMHCARVHR